MANIKYEVRRELGVLTDNNTTWQKLVRLVSWNQAQPKIDVRVWNTETGLPAKGIALSDEEARLLYQILEKYFKEREGSQ